MGFFKNQSVRTGAPYRVRSRYEEERLEQLRLLRREPLHRIGERGILVSRLLGRGNCGQQSKAHDHLQFKCDVTTRPDCTNTSLRNVPA